MINENSGAVEKLSDPGLPEHIHRKTDVDPRAAKKAERQVFPYFLLFRLLELCSSFTLTSGFQKIHLFSYR
ncbi:MAG: hypothetical protein RL730_265 [Actinomycetota bacterium]